MESRRPEGARADAARSGVHGLAVRCRPGAERERTGLAGGDSRYSGNSTAVNTSGCRLGGGLGGPRGLGAGALQRAEEDFEGRGDENWRGLGRGESRAHCGIRARSSQPPTSLAIFIYLPFSNPARSEHHIAFPHVPLPSAALIPFQPALGRCQKLSTQGPPGKPSYVAFTSGLRSKFTDERHTKSTILRRRPQPTHK